MVLLYSGRFDAALLVYEQSHKLDATDSTDHGTITLYGL